MSDLNIFRLTLDNKRFYDKPGGEDVADITTRMQEAGPTEYGAAAFCKHVKHGCTWCGGCFEPSANGWGEFVSQQIFAVDIDNKIELIVNGRKVKDSDGRIVQRALRPGEDGYLDPHDALARCEQFGLEPLCLYFTMTSRYPAWPKYRIVFDMGEPLDLDTAKAVIQNLLIAFPEADKKCSNCNRLFFGSNGVVWETWRVYAGAS